MERAFDVDEELPLPEDYILDEINDQSVEYLKKVDQQRQALEHKHSHKKNSIEIEYNLNVNNYNQFDNL